jgi:hypothetical protein
MKNKNYFVKKVCELKKIDLDSEEAKQLYSLTVVELLLEIKKYKPDSVPEAEEEEEEEEDRSFSKIAGCYN